MSETCPPTCPVRLVHHDLGVRQGEALALGAADQQDRAAAGGQADAIGGHRATEDLHGVVNGQRGADAAAGRIDVEVDVLAAVLALQVQELHHQLVGVAVMDLALEQDDAVLQQQIAQRQLPLPLIVAIRRHVRVHGQGMREMVIRHNSVIRYSSIPFDQAPVPARPSQVATHSRDALAASCVLLVRSCFRASPRPARRRAWPRGSRNDRRRRPSTPTPPRRFPRSGKALP